MKTFAIIVIVSLAAGCSDNRVGSNGANALAAIEDQPARVLNLSAGILNFPDDGTVELVALPTRSATTNAFAEFLRSDRAAGHIWSVDLDENDEIVGFLWNICAYADRAMLDRIYTLERLQRLDILLARGIDLDDLEGLARLAHLRSVRLMQFDESILASDFNELQRRIPHATVTRCVYLSDTRVPVSD